MPSATATVAAVAVIIISLLALQLPVQPGRFLLPTATSGNIPPTLAFRFGLSLIATLDSIVSWLTPPNIQLFRHTMAFMHTQHITAAANLGIADIVPLPPATATALDIAKVATDCNGGGDSSRSSSSSSICIEASLRIHRLLRACATLGVFRMRVGTSSSSSSSSSSSTDLWEHTPSSLLLRKDNPDSLRDTVLFMGGLQYEAAGSLPWAVKSGQSHFQRLHNMSAFEWFAQNHESAAVFDASMVQIGRLGGSGRAVAQDVDWRSKGALGYSDIEHIVDIGGGYGELLAEILVANPSIKSGVSFDTAAVVDRAQLAWVDGERLVNMYGKAVRDKIAFHSGNMFDATTFPRLTSPTALVMRDILHDWSDADAVVIIKAAADHIKGSNSSKHRIMIVFRPVVDGGSFISTFGAADADMLMLSSFGTSAGERSRSQLNSLLKAAGGCRELFVQTTRSLYAVMHVACD